MSAVARIDESGAVPQISQLRQVLSLLPGMNAQDAAGVAEKARQARLIAEAMKANAEVVCECCRLELHALRRLGQLGQSTLAPSSLRAAARRLGDLDDDQFAQVLALVQPFRSALGVFRSYEKALDAAQNEAWADYRRSGNGINLSEDYGLSDLKEAVATILERSDIQHSEALTVAEVAEELRAELGWASDTARTMALKEVVREALLADASGINDGDGAVWGRLKATGLPRYITCREDAEGGDPVWTRVPVGEATIEQAEWLLAYRREQIAQIRAKCRPIERLIALLRPASERNPDVRKMSDLAMKVTKDELAPWLGKEGK